MGFTINLLHGLALGRVWTETVIDLDPEAFGPGHVRSFRQGIAGYLGVEMQEVRVLGVARWKPILSVEIPAEGAERLVRAFEAKEPALLEALKALPIRSIVSDVPGVETVLTPPPVPEPPGAQADASSLAGADLGNAVSLLFAGMAGLAVLVLRPVLGVLRVFREVAEAFVEGLRWLMGGFRRLLEWLLGWVLVPAVAALIVVGVAAWLWRTFQDKGTEPVKASTVLSPPMAASPVATAPAPAAPAPAAPAPAETSLESASALGPGKEVALLSEDVSAIAFSDDGRRLTADAATGRYSWSMDGSTPPQLSPFRSLCGNADPRPSEADRMVPSPDGERLAVLRAGVVDVFCPGPVPTRLRLPGRILLQVIWSPDGRQLLTRSSRGELTAWRTAEGVARARPVDCGGFRPVDVVWSPEGRLVAAMSLRGKVLLWPSSLVGEPIVLHMPGGRRGALAWSPDGERLAASAMGGTFHVHRMSSLSSPLRFAERVAVLTGAEWSPDGRFVLTTATDGAVRIWRSDTAEEVVTFESSTQVQAAAWSGNGRRIALVSTNRDVRVYDVPW